MTDTATGGRAGWAVRQAACTSAGVGPAWRGAAHILPRAGSSLSAETTDVLSDRRILQEPEPEAETSWKARGALTACPPGVRAISWSPAHFHHLRALSVGSPGGRGVQTSHIPLPGCVGAAQAGLHGPWLRRGAWAGMSWGAMALWPRGCGGTPSSAAALQEHSSNTSRWPRSRGAECHSCHSSCTLGLKHLLWAPQKL